MNETVDVSLKGDMEAARLAVFVLDEGELFSQPHRELMSSTILRRMGECGWDPFIKLRANHQWPE